MRGANNSVDTVNAAAMAIASAENRVQQDTGQKRRWGGCWSFYWCFGSQKQCKRIGHAVFVPEPTMPAHAASAAEDPTHPPTTVLPIVAPPSSPVSFLQSEPPSATQSPAGLVSLTSLSANVYSPGPSSIFAIGPYAHEMQLVSPPVFSTFTTEPSTAPFTPPPELVQQTTPSSPEVPFAQLLTPSLDPNHRNSVSCQKYPLSHYEFNSYQLYPGSPVGYLISPSSAISGSGTSSPFPDPEFTTGRWPFLDFHSGNPPKLCSIDQFSNHKWGPQLGSGSVTPDATVAASRDSFLLENQISEVASLANSDNGSQDDDITIDHRYSFDLNTEEVARCVEKEATTSVEDEDRDEIASEEDKSQDFVAESSKNMPERAPGDGEEELRYQKHRSITLGSAKEFNFDKADGGASDKPAVNSDWWTDEKVVREDVGSRNNWAFFPMMQPGVS